MASGQQPLIHQHPPWEHAMWFALVVLGFFVLLAAMGISGVGVHDSRDTRFSLVPRSRKCI